jgi:hypothetical protein
LVDEFPGPCSSLAAQAIVFLRLRRLGKRGHDLMTIERVNRSEQLSQNLLIFAPFTTDPNGARIKPFTFLIGLSLEGQIRPAPHSDGRDARAPASQIQGKCELGKAVSQWKRSAAPKAQDCYGRNSKKKASRHAKPDAQERIYRRRSGSIQLAGNLPWTCSAG